MSDNKKDDIAVALTYERGVEHAPRLSAKGSGSIAQQILQIAKENNVPVVEDANLVEILTAIELDSFIPLEAYAVVAEILSYIYSKNDSGDV